MSNEQKNLSTRNRQFWQKTIETWQNSGMSIREFCKAEGLQESTFYNWRKKLTDSQSQVNKQVLKDPSAFIKVALPESEHAFLELELSSGSTLRIPSGTDNKTLSSVLSVLREVGLC
jgi:transposase-like protein